MPCEKANLRPTDKNITFINFLRTDLAERCSRVSIYRIIKDIANLMSFNSYDNKTKWIGRDTLLIYTVHRWGRWDR